MYKVFDKLDRFRQGMLALTGVVLIAVAVWGAMGGYTRMPPGDYETKQGDILLDDGKFALALNRFEAALAANPDHRGAMMGRAISLLQQGRTEAAEEAFGDTIALLEKAPPDDATGRGALAAAYANRGILYDRGQQPERALADYRRALAIDAAAVSGPGLVDRVLYGTPDAASVAKRVAYLEGQMRLPPERRVLSRPDIDSRQRMHKP
ncbi:tetratricopeptide repeat protein [Shumkonia mesophila]|uniref:tetratricopeptide repeat protein n=1 Tax=Shumkonia mesophila TaxID=2838854 RepID=UPI0029344A5F|nr:tetratricopeptide repeat protein [Shumkonia mesophila]